MANNQVLIIMNFFKWDSLKTQFSTISNRKNIYLLTEWEGRTENIWVEVMTDQAQRRPCAMTECQISSLPAQTNSIKTNFTIYGH